MSGNQRGFTLLDAVIAVSLLVVILALAYPGFKISNDTITTGGRRDRMERAGDRLLRTVVETIRAGRVTGMTDSPPSITVVRPQSGIALEELGSDGAVPWEDKALTLRFRQTGVFKESDANADLNRDGDRHDDFALGVIEIVHGSVVRPITETARVVLGLPDYNGDLDGDGEKDPLFVRNGRSIRIRIQLLVRPEESRRLTTVVRGGVRLRNIQE